MRIFSFIVIMSFLVPCVSYSFCRQNDIQVAQYVAADLTTFSRMNGYSSDVIFLAIGPKEGQEKRTVNIPTSGRGIYLLLVSENQSRKSDRPFIIYINGKKDFKDKVKGTYSGGIGKVITEFHLKQDDKIEIEVFGDSCLIGGFAELM